MLETRGTSKEDKGTKASAEPDTTNIHTLLSLKRKRNMYDEEEEEEGFYLLFLKCQTV